MPIKGRHFIRELGAVASGAQSPELFIGEGTKAMLFLAGSGAVVTPQFSPDGGTTWHDLYDQDDNPIIFTVTATPGAYQIEITGELFRISVGTANITAAYIEGIREIG
jgi:hypothetical protein